MGKLEFIKNVNTYSKTVKTALDILNGSMIMDNSR